MQREICEARDIFEPDGRVMCAGWARLPVLNYNKEQSKTRSHHCEIDTYFVSNGEISLYMSLENLGRDFSVKIAAADIRRGGVLFDGVSKSFIINKVSLHGSLGTVNFIDNRIELQIENTPDGKIMRCRFESFGGKGLYFSIRLRNSGGDVLSEIAPFERDRRYFYFKRFAPRFTANGVINIGGLEYRLANENSTAYTDIIRFSKPRPHNYQRLGCDCLTGEGRFSLCLASRVGDNRFGNENCFFMNGGIEKLSQINVKNTGGKLDRPWYFTAGYSAVDISFKPFTVGDEPMAAFIGSTAVLFGKLYGEIKRVNLKKPVVLDNMPAHLVITEF